MILKKKPSNKNLKIFIAGHNGMVGKAVLNILKKKKFTRILTLDKNKIDLREKKLIINYFKKEKPSIVINCAARVGGIHINNKNKVEFLEENIEINQNIFKACYEAKISKLIFLGSSCIYPNNITRKIVEEDLLSSHLEETNEAYALAKIVGIKLCDFYNKQHGTDYRAIMPCNLFGPNDNYNSLNSHVLPALIKKVHIAKKKKLKFIEVWGDGSSKREFLFVDDLAKYIFKILFISKYKFQKISYKSFINVGSQFEYKIINLVKIISEVLKYPVNIRYINKNLKGTNRKKLNDTRFKRYIQKKNDQTNFKDSILKTYLSFLNAK
jgi:GDP-L-fucose synthase